MKIAGLVGLIRAFLRKLSKKAVGETPTALLLLESPPTVYYEGKISLSFLKAKICKKAVGVTQTGAGVINLYYNHK